MHSCQDVVLCVRQHIQVTSLLFTLLRKAFAVSEQNLDTAPVYCCGSEVSLHPACEFFWSPWSLSIEAMTSRRQGYGVGVRWY